MFACLVYFLKNNFFLFALLSNPQIKHKHTQHTQHTPPYNSSVGDCVLAVLSALGKFSSGGTSARLSGTQLCACVVALEQTVTADLPFIARDDDGAGRPESDKLRMLVVSAASRVVEGIVRGRGSRLARAVSAIAACARGALARVMEAATSHASRWRTSCVLAGMDVHTLQWRHMENSIIFAFSRNSDTPTKPIFCFSKPKNPKPHK
jgi:hypothetical protein